MRALIVVTHPEPGSLTQTIARRIAKGVADAGHDAQIADLAAEGFDPRFGDEDLLVHRTRASPPADVATEQRRIEAADRLVIVFPIYWWSMPGLLKGWIDRVFSNGWAFDFSPQAGLEKRLQRLEVDLVAIGGSDAPTFERHGYAAAMRTQIDHGIFDYCGARVRSSEMLLDTETSDPAPHLERADAIGLGLFADDKTTAAA